MKKKFLKIIAIALAALSVTATVGCSGNKENVPSTSWEVRTYNDGNGSADTQYVKFSVTRNSKKIDEVWLNVNKVSGDTSIAFSSSSDGNKKQITVSKSDVKKAKKDAYGWIKVVDDWNFDSSTVKMSLVGGITLNEIVFVSEESKRLSVSLSEAKIYYIDSDGKAQGSQEAYNNSELDAILGSKTGLPTLLIDEQAKFDKK